MFIKLKYFKFISLKITLILVLNYFECMIISIILYKLQFLFIYLFFILCVDIIIIIYIIF